MEELEHKIMTKKRFTLAIEACVVKNKMSYIDAMTYIIEQRGMDLWLPDFGATMKVLSSNRA